MTACAALLAAGAVLTFLTVSGDALRAPTGEQVEPECRRHCSVGAPQLQPEPEAVPAGSPGPDDRNAAPPRP